MWSLENEERPWVAFCSFFQNGGSYAITGWGEYGSNASNLESHLSLHFSIIDLRHTAYLHFNCVHIKKRHYWPGLCAMPYYLRLKQKIQFEFGNEPFHDIRVIHLFGDSADHTFILLWFLPAHFLPSCLDTQAQSVCHWPQLCMGSYMLGSLKEKELNRPWLGPRAHSRRWTFGPLDINHFFP